MKKTIFLLFALVFTLKITGQTVDKSSPAPQKVAVPVEAVEAAIRTAEKFNLTIAQTEKMQSIEARKIKNLAEIEPLKATNPAKYRLKLANVQTGWRGSLRHLLDSKEQMAIYNQRLVEIRRLKAAKEQELKTQNAPKTEIDDALLEIDGQF